MPGGLQVSPGPGLSLLGPEATPAAFLAWGLAGSSRRVGLARGVRSLQGPSAQAGPPKPFLEPFRRPSPPPSSGKRRLSKVLAPAESFGLNRLADPAAKELRIASAGRGAKTHGLGSRFQQKDVGLLPGADPTGLGLGSPPGFGGP